MYSSISTKPSLFLSISSTVSWKVQTINEVLWSHSSDYFLRRAKVGRLCCPCAADDDLRLDAAFAAPTQSTRSGITPVGAYNMGEIWKIRSSRYSISTKSRKYNVSKTNKLSPSEVEPDKGHAVQANRVHMIQGYWSLVCLHCEGARCIRPITPPVSDLGTVCACADDVLVLCDWLARSRSPHRPH